MTGSAGDRNCDSILNKLNLLASLNLLEKMCLQYEDHSSDCGANALDRLNSDSQ
ncbi:MAG: hypothetical protein ACODAD_15110 [Planctomycetota bacterium]